MIKVGIFGSENSHAAALTKLLNGGAHPELSGFQVMAIGGEDDGQTDKLSREWGLEKAAHTRDMVGKIDAGIITSRDGALHLGYARPLIEAGIPLFVDKPVTNEVGEALELAALAKRRKVPLVGGSSVKLCDKALSGGLCRVLGPRLAGGSVYAPVNMDNPYGGFYFYSAHLAELALAVFGMAPQSVAAHKSDAGVTGILHYPQFDVSLCFVSKMQQYGVTVFGREGGARSFELDIGAIHERGALAFAHMVKYGRMSASYESLIQSVYLVNAIKAAYETGRTQSVGGGVRVDRLWVNTYASRKAMGAAAAKDAARAFAKNFIGKPEINVVFAAAPSQNEFLEALLEYGEIDWTRVNALHMDEYIGLPADAPQGFGNFLRNAVFGRVPFKSVHYINGLGDPRAECARYAALLEAFPPDFVCMGVGENGHIAFNDPPVADFHDPHAVKVVNLDQICRRQQVNDGCFQSLDQVPKQALTLTVPALMRAGQIFCIVPAKTKANAIRDLLKGPVGEACPATALRNHPNAALYLDADSASLI